MPFYGSFERLKFLENNFYFRTDGRTDGRADGRTGGRTDGRADGRTGGRADGRTDGQTDGRAGIPHKGWKTTALMLLGVDFLVWRAAMAFACEPDSNYRGWNL